MTRYANFPLCGCWYTAPANQYTKRYLPQVKLESHTVILATTSRTTLRQTFHNPSRADISEAVYTFPLYDGVSVAAFQCSVQDRVLTGVVKEKNQARTEYKEAVDRGETAALLEQDMNAADVFTTSIGNVPAGGQVLVEITYLGELKNDAETDGARFTIPTQIAPRYGGPIHTHNTRSSPGSSEGMSITVDITLEEGSVIRGIQSPSHPIAVTMGTTSTQMQDEDSFESHLASSTLTLGTTELDKDFVVVVLAKGQDTPRALLETHPSIPDQKALMATLVPKFNIPNDNPEIVFIVDRSGSMHGNMHLVIEALKVFLKSLPVGVKFNICSFGSRHDFLFSKSKTYDASSLKTAMKHVDPSTFQANYGGTEMLNPCNDVLKKRYKDLPLEVILLTDGQIWNQTALFEVINKASTENARFFSIGVGSSASSSLVEGIARAGRGFSQWVLDGERIDKRIVRMLKGALSPHIDYKVEIKYAQDDLSDEDDFELVESFEKSMKLIGEKDATQASEKSILPKISLFNPTAKDEPTNPSTGGRYDHLPKLSVPRVLQTPDDIPPLFPHNRTTIYLLLGPDTRGRTPQSITLCGKSVHGDLELEIPVQDVGQGETIHKLAAKKAMQELEEDRGWLTKVTSSKGKTLKSQHEGKWDLIVEREAVRLGTTFQIAGKFCSFVALQKSGDEVMSPPSYDEVSPQEVSSNAAPVLGMALAKSAGNDASANPRGGFSGTFGRLLGRSSMSGSSQAPRKQLASKAARRSSGTAAISYKMAAPAPAPAMDTRLRSVAPQSAPGGGAFLAQQSSGSYAVRGEALGGGPPGGALYGASASYAPPPPARNSAPKKKMMSFGGGSGVKERKKELEVTMAEYRTRGDMNSVDSYCVRRGKADTEMEMDVDEEDDGDGDDDGWSGPAPAGASPLEKMQQLISLQSFSGSWSATNELLTIISHGAKTPFADTFKDAKNLQDSVTKQVGSSGNASLKKLTAEDCATAMAITWLQTVMDDEEDVWEMVVDKAKGYLESRVGDSGSVDTLLDALRGIWT